MAASLGPFGRPAMRIVRDPRSWSVAAAVLATATVVIARAEPTTAVAPGDERPAARVELGRRLFFDPAVSRAGRTSCGSCHDPEHGFTDRAHPSKDEWGDAARRTMPLADLPARDLH